MCAHSSTENIMLRNGAANVYLRDIDTQELKHIIYLAYIDLYRHNLD